MGMTASLNRLVAPGSIAWRAVMPREDMAKLMERCCAAAFEEGRRMSGAPSEIPCDGPEPGTRWRRTWTAFVDFHKPALFGQHNGAEASHGPCTNNHGLSSKRIVVRGHVSMFLRPEQPCLVRIRYGCRSMEWMGWIRGVMVILTTRIL